MVYVLTTYIKLQLEMKMSPELHDKLRPAIWAIFQATDENARHRTVCELDAQGKIVWDRLFHDWVKFGKYHGN